MIIELSFMLTDKFILIIIVSDIKCNQTMTKGMKVEIPQNRMKIQIPQMNLTPRLKMTGVSLNY